MTRFDQGLARDGHPGGDILRVEDIEGRGHRTRTVNDQPRRSLFLPLD
jgi:hypothetical protein